MQIVTLYVCNCLRVSLFSQSSGF